MTTYRYRMEGVASGEQTWKTEGEVSIDELGDFPSVLQKAVVQSFNTLTRGRAVYGQPGVGCSGPYGITRCVIELKT